MGTYKIDISRDISLENLFVQFNIIDNNYDENVYNDIIVDFSSCRYISPSSLAVLTSYLKNKKTTSSYLDIFIEPGLYVDTYIARVDFYNLLEIENTEYFSRRNEAGRFTTIKNINEENYELVDEIMDILVTHDCVSDEIYYSMDWSFNELLDNVFQHSKSINGGFLIAQSYDDRVEFCVVDNGIGISTSLKQNQRFSHLNDLECLVRATEKDVTVGTGQGNGLYITRRFIERNYGELHIYSNNSHVYINNGKMFAEDLDCKWDGTAIILKVCKNINIDIFDVFDTNNFDSLPSGYCDRNSEKNFSLW